MTSSHGLQDERYGGRESFVVQSEHRLVSDGNLPFPTLSLNTHPLTSHKKKADALTFGRKAISWKESNFFFLLAFPSSFHQKRRYLGILYLPKQHDESQIFPSFA
jgi:hypothetical protein